ncbi:MAG: MFS transporter [Pseudomonadales bacterium]|nr:MFS transporter [Halioglobus sp.]MCP5131280.1 MFS transporter [Pseudomonadales bacterium]
MTETKRRNSWLRETLSVSRKEAVASAAMTGISDNYLGAFAIFLRASLPQMGMLAALPQLAGAAFQLLSVWLCSHFHRRQAIVSGVALQATSVLGMALVALVRPEHGVAWLIGLAVVYHACANFVQPQWRSWMGSIVPPRRRGAFFAGRTRLTMITSFTVFACGGALLGWFERFELAWLGFFLLLLLAAVGRGLSAWQLHLMHDPDQQQLQGGSSFVDTLGRVRESFHHRAFREYSLFFAVMQGAVGISGPFFSVYMLNDLGYSYWQFTCNIGISILTQFFTLSTWGYICDRWGNRLVMVTSCCMLPVLPALWLFSDDYYYLLGVQVVSGLAWGGFTLSTSNYLYDLRPTRADFASYAAVQSALSAVGVFFGALLGGYLASALPALMALLPEAWRLEHSVVLIFATSSLFRVGIAAWFIPRSVELRVRHRPDLLHVVYRVARFTPGAGIVLDWLTVTRKSRR